MDRIIGKKRSSMQEQTIRLRAMGRWRKMDRFPPDKAIDLLRDSSRIGPMTIARISKAGS